MLVCCTVLDIIKHCCVKCHHLQKLLKYMLTLHLLRCNPYFEKKAQQVIFGNSEIPITTPFC